jgi:hypothetical protein
MILTASFFPGSKINDLIMNEKTCRRNKFTNKPDAGLKTLAGKWMTPDIFLGKNPGYNTWLLIINPLANFPKVSAFRAIAAESKKHWNSIPDILSK